MLLISTENILLGGKKGDFSYPECNHQFQLAKEKKYYEKAIYREVQPVSPSQNSMLRFCIMASGQHFRVHIYLTEDPCKARIKRVILLSGWKDVTKF